MAKIVGYAAVFDSPSGDLGGFTETIDPHAFDGVINARNLDVVCTFNHKSDNLLGRKAAHTLRLNVDSRGLRYECDVPNTNLGVDVYELVKRGDVATSSFQFVSKRDEWQIDASGNVRRRILEVGDLIDVSPVTWPAYPTTSAALA
jgi:HK97 family phage prohead protease